MTTDAKKLLKISIFFIFSLLIILYAFYRTKALVFGVKIQDVSIAERDQTRDGIMKVKGSAENALKLYLDGREIPIDEKGNFEDTVALLPGYNMMVIQAEDKFGHKDEKYYKLTF